MAKDLVCGMQVDEQKAPAKAEYKGRTYCFCAPRCKTAFEKDPEKYIREEAGEDRDFAPVRPSPQKLLKTLWGRITERPAACFRQWQVGDANRYTD